MPLKMCLVVDDSPAVRKVARRILEKLNCEVDEAENGQIGLQRCIQRMPDAVLLDWNMPVMNGIDLLRLLRAMEKGGAPRVVVCTTEGDVSHIREAIDNGADEYLIKPFDALTLSQKLFPHGT
jgi:two-component system chemotaxis response regulator CheY